MSPHSFYKVITTNFDFNDRILCFMLYFLCSFGQLSEIKHHYYLIHRFPHFVYRTYKLPDLVFSPVYTAPPPSTTTPRPVLPPVENIPGLTILGDNPHEVTPDMTPQEAEVKFYKYGNYGR